MLLSLYPSKESTKPQNISIEFYVQAIQEGMWQDFVFPARSEFQANGKSKKYTFIKSQAPSILGSCVMKPGSKDRSNIDHMNGLLVVDIDEALTEEGYQAIKNDKYTHILHKSISGVNYCAFIKIEKTKKFKEIFDGVCKYYYDNFNINIDISCSNENRIRFASYDPDIYYNASSSIFRSIIKRKEPKKKDVNYIFTQSDFDLILQQIKDRGIDLCRDDYNRFVRIGMSIANELGESGRDAFHLICSSGTKYKHEKEDKTYTGFLKSGKGESSIGTFYYLCKEEGIDVYSEKTKTIINRVKVSKSQGKPTVESIKSTLKIANDIEANEEDENLIKRLIESKTDYSQNANAELSETEQLENFIKQTYSPKKDVISQERYVFEDTALRDWEINDIYLNCKKQFDFNVSKNDVISILNSSTVKKIDVLRKFFSENSHNETGYIEKYISAISPKSEYNLWAFKRWVVGAIHNWMSPENELLICPLTLVLCGQGHGIGKTSFFRNVMPEELRRYFYEGRIDAKDKDSLFRLASNLVMFDDEFGGSAVKDAKDYKSISDKPKVTQRRPYATMDETFKRKAILCGSTNELDILKDVTGNRRILPIYVEKVDYPLITSMDHTKLIVEAYNLWKSGFDWKIYKPEDIEYLNENTEQNNMVLPVEEIFLKYFSFEATTRHRDMVIRNHGEILSFLSNVTNVRVTRFDVKDIFTKNKITYQTHRLGNDEVKKGIKLYTDLKVKNKEDEDEIPF